MTLFHLDLDERLESRLYELLQDIRHIHEATDDKEGWVDDIRAIETALLDGRGGDDAVPALGRWVKSRKVLPKVDPATLLSKKVLLRWPDALAKVGHLDLNDPPTWVRADSKTRHPVHDVPEWMLLSE